MIKFRFVKTVFHTENFSLYSYVQIDGFPMLNIYLNLAVFLKIRPSHVSFVLQGMAYLEERGIVHRDLAARNVLGKSFQ